VLEVEGRFVSGQTGDWALHFRTWRYDLTNEDGKYAVVVHSDGHIDVFRFESENESLLGSVSSGVKSGTETNSLRLIAVGPEIALYANGEPIFYVSDAGFSDRFRSGDMLLVVCNKQGTIPIRVQFDNLEIWEIADLALPLAEATPAPQPTATPTPRPSLAEEARAFAEPILAAIADRPPDYKDDFSDPGSGWSLRQSTEGEARYEDGEYVAVAAPDYWSGGDSSLLPEFSDFVGNKWSFCFGR